jgi:small-conductance mechanosensitive channel
MEPVTGALDELLRRLALFFPKIVVALVVFVFALILAGVAGRLIHRILTKREVDPELTLLMTRLGRWTMIVLGSVVALEQVDFDLTAFLTGLGILGFTVGFAIQDVSKNFVAGILLLLQQPFDIGDAIEVGGFSGTVVTVDLRATELLTFDGKNVLIPNADVFTSPIVHFGRGNRRRVELSVGVSYDSDLEVVKLTAVESIAQVDGVVSEPAPSVVFDMLAESTVNFTLYYWIDTRIIGLFDAKDAGVRKVKRSFDEAGIEMPYPIQTVRLEQ